MLRIFSSDKTVLIKNALVGGYVTDVLVKNGKIAKIASVITEACDVVFDAENSRLVPGLIDVHCHGCMGDEASDGKEAQVRMSRFWAENGTTTWYPTGTTLAIKDLQDAFAEIPETPDGANIAGYHSEGPYISYTKRGAQSESYIKKPELSDFDDLETVKLITLAPETDEDFNYIRSTRLLCVVGHTEANYDTALAAFRAGAKCVTHLFNAMPPLHHRDPSVLGAAFDGDAYVQVISDGIHLHPSVVRMTYQLFGVRRMVLISDAVRPALFKDGRYISGKKSVTVKNGVATLDDTGVLAGSTSSLYTCVQRAISFGIPPVDAYRMASETPAVMMGLKKGKIEVGYDAEFLVLDENWHMKDVMICNK